ncbi:MAG: hypothetical protein SOI38_05045 [Eggerthellaceae bacterium]|jgi:hypothetical protein
MAKGTEMMDKFNDLVGKPIKVRPVKDDPMAGMMTVDADATPEEVAEALEEANRKSLNRKSLNR